MPNLPLTQSLRSVVAPHTARGPNASACLQVNQVLMVLVLFVAGTFQHSSNLTSVYGACVSSAMFLTTMLWTGVLTHSIGLPFWASLLLTSPFHLLDGSLLTANLAKFFSSGPVQLSYPGYTTADAGGATMGPVPQNAWVSMVPLMVAIATFACMISYLWGRRMANLDNARLSAVFLAASRSPDPRLSAAVEGITVAMRLPSLGAQVILPDDPSLSGALNRRRFVKRQSSSGSSRRASLALDGGVGSSFQDPLWGASVQLQQPSFGSTHKPKRTPSGAGEAMAASAQLRVPETPIGVLAALPPAEPPSTIPLIAGAEAIPEGAEEDDVDGFDEGELRNVVDEALYAIHGASGLKARRSA